MKLKFCGEVDCPDWILAQLFHLSRWAKQDFELICKSVKETVLDGGGLEEDELFAKLGLFDSRTTSSATNHSSRLDIDDVRACFGALSYILVSARKYCVSEHQLRVELEQLGLAAEHLRVLCKQLDGQDRGSQKVD